MSAIICVKNEDSFTVLELAGRLVGRGNRDLSDGLEKLDNDANTFKAIDLTGVEFFDSYALGQILFHCNSMKSKSTKVCLVNRNRDDQKYINRLIKISELHQIVPVVPSLHNAQSIDFGLGD